MHPVVHTKAFVFWVTLTYAFIGIVLAFFHEIGIDEAYHFLLARDSHSVSALIVNGTTNGSGHPVTWNLMIKCAQLIFPAVISMQLLHVLCGTVAIYIIARHASFTRLEVVMLAGGYFFVYEYYVIAKNYMPGFALIFAAIALFSQERRLWTSGICLALAANFHLFTLFVSCALGIYFWLSRRKKERGSELVLFIAVLLAGLIAALIQIIPSSEMIAAYKPYNDDPLFSWSRAARSLGAICRGMLNVPDFGSPHFWNTNIIFSHSRLAAYGSGVIIGLAVLWSLRRSPFALLFFLLPCCMIMGFVYFAPLATGVRYWGYFYVLLVLAVWLVRRQGDESTLLRVLFRSMLFIQVPVGIAAIAVDLNRPFSNSKYAAELAGKGGQESLPLFASRLSIGPSLAAYTGKMIYYPSNGTFESFNFWMNYKDYTPEAFVRESTAHLRSMKADSCMLVSHQPLPVSEQRINGMKLREAGRLEGSVTTEDFYLYVLSDKRKE